MTLIGRIDAKRKPEYLPGVDVNALKGKLVLTPFRSGEIYGPFDSLEQLQEWAKANPDKADPPKKAD